MKFDELRSIGHNIAHSLASGNGLLIGTYGMDVFDEAGHSQGGFLTVDFLMGCIVHGTPSARLTRAVALYRDALADLCEKHGASPSAFCELTARYSTDRHGPRFAVSVADQNGHRSVDEYDGWVGRRAKVLDHLGRVRPK